MFISEMYKIEKIIHSYKMSGITDLQELIELRHKHKFSSGGGWYYRSAAIIPYPEMLEHIGSYNNEERYMDETDEIFWWDRLYEKYNKYNGQPILFSVNDTICRFKDVERLSKSPIYGKRLAELYDIDRDKNTKSNKSRVLIKTNQK